MTRHFRTIMLSLALLPTLAISANAQTAAEVVDRHLAAVGGRAALEKLTSRKATGTFTVTTPAGDLSGPAELSFKAPNKSRALITLDLTALGAPENMVIEQLFDGTSGWSLNSMQGEVPMTARQADNQRNNVFPTPLLNYKGAGTTIDLLPKEKVNERDAFVLRLTPKAGTPVRLFIDAETYLVVRAIATVDSPEAGALEQTSESSDYRTVDGVKIAFMVVTQNSLQTITLKLDKVEHNVAIDDAVFVKK